jgi:hypothetical protein
LAGHELSHAVRCHSHRPLRTRWVAFLLGARWRTSVFSRAHQCSVGALTIRSSGPRTARRAKLVRCGRGRLSQALGRSKRFLAEAVLCTRRVHAPSPRFNSVRGFRRPASRLQVQARSHGSRVAHRRSRARHVVRALQGLCVLVAPFRQAITVSASLSHRRRFRPSRLLRGVLHPNYSFERTADRRSR